jgi:glycosyltransferase involved in cell wall biosynthesis
MISISVIVPAHQAAATIGETLASVRGQSRAADELLVVDDGSTDATGAIATAAGAKVISRPNGGVAAALNAGLAAALGDLVAFLDADDLWAPDCLRLHEHSLIDHPDAAGSVARFSEFVCPTLAANVAARFAPRTNQPAWVAGGTVVRREAFERAGPLDESLRVGAWVEWVDRARHAGCTFKMIDSLLLLRRLRPGTLSQAASRNADLLAVARAAIARRGSTSS